MPVGSLWQRGAGGLACRLRRLASLSASAASDQRLRWGSESSAQASRLPAQEPCTSGAGGGSEPSRLAAQAASSARWGGERREGSGLLCRRVLAAALTAAGGSSLRGLTSHARPKKPPRQKTSESAIERPKEPVARASDNLVAHYKAVLKKLLAGRGLDGFRLALRKAKQKGHMAHFHQAIVDELKHDPPAKLSHEILLHRFASDIRNETDLKTTTSLAKTMLCFMGRVKELVLLALNDESLAKFQRSSNVISTLKCLMKLLEHTGDQWEMREELRSDAAWVEKFRRLYSQELGREEPALNMQATFRLVRMAQGLRLTVSEDVCRGLCRAIRWELREWDRGRTCWLRGKDVENMLTWMRRISFPLWEEEAELMETIVCWLLDPANSSTTLYPSDSIEVLAGLAAESFGAFSSALDKVERRSELSAFLSSLYRDPRRLALLDKRGQYFLYKLDSLIGINEAQDLPRMGQPHLGCLSHLAAGGIRTHEYLRVERCPLQQILGREELQKALGRVKEGNQLSQVYPLPFSARVVVVEHPMGAPVPVLAQWKLVHSLEEVRPPSELRLFFPLDEWEVGPKGEPWAELSQQMALLRRLGYHVVPFHLRFQGRKTSAASAAKLKASAKAAKEALRPKAAKASAAKTEPSAKPKEAKPKAARKRKAASEKAPPPEPPEERARRFRDARRKAQEGQWA